MYLICNQESRFLKLKNMVLRNFGKLVTVHIAIIFRAVLQSFARWKGRNSPLEDEGNVPRGNRALSRSMLLSESGAPSPSRPRSASSKSPRESPCRYNSGSMAPSSSVRRTKSGSNLLSNGSSLSQTRGRRTVSVQKLVRPPWLAEPVAISGRGINGTLALTLDASEEVGDLSLQELLKPLLDVAFGHGLKLLEGDVGRRGGDSQRLLHGGVLPHQVGAW